MKVLVFSDSHSSLRFMREMMSRIRPDAVIHLGDHFDDAGILAEEVPGTTVLRVPGNCDMFRVYGEPETLCPQLFGVRLYMTHGHRHGVKQSLYKLLQEARQAGAQAALYGHTHRADLHWEEDGLLVLNPGSSGSGGSAALLELCDGKIKDCRLIDERDLTK